MSVQLRDRARSSRLVLLVGGLTAVLAVIGSMVLGRFALTDDAPGFVSLSIDNPTDLPLDVDLVDRSGSTLRLARLEPRSKRQLQEVLDQGDTWTFMVSLAGREVHRTQPIPRADLQARGWKWSIPTEVQSMAPAGPAG